MASYGKHLFDLGYTVLLPDARGHGESEGDYIGMGWPERRDVVRWCQQLIAEDPEAEIVLYGVSMQADGVSRVVSQKLDRATGKVVNA